MAINGLDGLKGRHKVFEFRNRSQSAETIYLANGDTMMVPAGAVGKQRSELFTQLPAMSTFDYVTPSIDEVIEAGIIETKQQAQPVKPVEPEKPIDETSKQKGGQPLKSSGGPNS